MTYRRRQPTDYLVTRLARLCCIRVERAGDLNAMGVLLLDRCIWAAFRDCCELGREPEASALMHSLMVELASGGLR